MPSLQVRKLPDNVYQLLREKAIKEHRSLAREAVVTLAKGLETSVTNKDRRKKLIKSIADHPCLSGNDKGSTPLDPVPLVREDRER